MLLHLILVCKWWIRLVNIRKRSCQKGGTILAHQIFDARSRLKCYKKINFFSIFESRTGSKHLVGQNCAPFLAWAFPIIFTNLIHHLHTGIKCKSIDHVNFVNLFWFLLQNEYKALFGKSQDHYCTMYTFKIKVKYCSYSSVIINSTI